MNPFLQQSQALRLFVERATVSFAHLFSTSVVGWFTAHFRDSLLGCVRFATRVCSGRLDSAGLGSVWGWSRLLPKPQTVRYTCLTSRDHADRVPRRDRVGSGRCCALVPSPAVPEMPLWPGPKHGHATPGAVSFPSAHSVETGPRVLHEAAARSLLSPCPRGQGRWDSLHLTVCVNPLTPGACGRSVSGARPGLLPLWLMVSQTRRHPPSLPCLPPIPPRDGVMSPPWGWARCALSASLSGCLSLCLSCPIWTRGVSLGPRESLQDSLGVLLACCIFERVPALRKLSCAGESHAFRAPEPGPAISPGSEGVIF